MYQIVQDAVYRFVLFAGGQVWCTTVAGVGFIMLPLTWRIATAKQMKKMTVVDFSFTNICHISNLFTQIRLNSQIAQSSFFMRFSKYSRYKIFISHNSPCWDLNPCFGEIKMAKNQKSVLGGNVCKNFL